jgi:hypothetical protein
MSTHARHWHYNTDKFPFLVAKHSRNHWLYADSEGYCASIPSPQGQADGCNASHFGDPHYVRATLGIDVLAAITKEERQQ